MRAIRLIALSSSLLTACGTSSVAELDALQSEAEARQIALETEIDELQRQMQSLGLIPRAQKSKGGRRMVGSPAASGNERDILRLLKKIEEL